MASQTIEVMGWPAEIHGYADDPYFREAQLHSANNKVLIAQAMALEPGGVIVDVGANIGLMALNAYRACWPDRYIAVEPSSLARECLVRTAAANQMDALEVVPFALGADCSDQPFSESQYLAGSFIDQQGTGRVECKSLDQMVADLALQRIDLIKIDVEGHEPQVLAGATATFRQFNPMVVLEFCSWTLSAQGNASPMGVAMDLIEIGGGGFYTMRGGEPVRVQSRDDAKLFLLQNMEMVVEDVWFRAT